MRRQISCARSRPVQFESLEDRQLLSTVTVGANVNTTRAAGNQVETEIAINPANPRNVVSVSMNQASNSSTLMVSRSYDGGATWTASLLGNAQDKMPANTPRVDPHVTFDAFGNAFVVYEVASSSSEIRVIVARSSDGGATWAASTAVSGQGLNIDYPFIATGPDATRLSRQTVWVGYTDTRTMRIRMVAARTTGLGALGAFTAPVTVADSKGSYGSAAVGPAGQVAVTWQNNPDGQGFSRIYVDVDADGLGTARTWGRDVVAATTNVGGYDYIPAQPNRSVFSNCQLQFDRAPGSATKGRLYLVYADEVVDEKNDLNVILKYSNNLGGTWSAGLRVNDDKTAASQFLPVLAVDQTSGNVGIVWHDARNSAANNTAQIWGTFSINHGVSVLANFRISAGTSNQAGANGALDDMDFGDYAGLAFHGGKMIASWADNSNSTLNNPNGTGKQLDVYMSVVTLLA